MVLTVVLRGWHLFYFLQTSTLSHISSVKNLKYSPPPRYREQSKTQKPWRTPVQEECFKTVCALKRGYRLIKFCCLPGSDKYGTSLGPLRDLGGGTSTPTHLWSRGLPRCSVMDVVSADFWFLELIVEDKI